MFEDALFGHVRGAYTGAVNEAQGFLREANGGTAFFDEISGLPLSQQAKLLRAIETGEFRPIGATRDARSEFRVVAATNERLIGLSERGAFRSDLRHRLSGVIIAVPALAERTDDIPHLARHFVQMAVAAGAQVPSIDGQAMRLLMDAHWPGNIRELKQVVDTATAFAHGVIGRSVIESAMAHRSIDVRSRSVVHEIRGRRELVAVLSDVAWDVDSAATRLGLHRATLYRRMKRYGIDAARDRPFRLEEAKAART
jgi:DNA-binding NtrC family response regulator